MEFDMLEVGLPVHGDGIVLGLLLHMLQLLPGEEELLPVDGSIRGPQLQLLVKVQRGEM